MKIDAHQHFWSYNTTDYGWMTADQSSLRRDFLPRDFEPVLRHSGFEGSIAVEARQLLAETEWLLDLADRHEFIKGVVGSVDLRSDRVEEQLAKYATHSKLRGVRHVVHDEPDDDFILGADFQRGIARLAQFDLRYDLLVFPRHLANTIKLVGRFPDQPFVVDHLAKPNIRHGALSPWRELMRQLADFPNVSCKLSGLVTEADWSRWRPADLIPYLNVAFEAFGAERLMIGSDWPVCTLAGSYQTVMSVVLDYAAALDERARRGVLGENCARVYSIVEPEVKRTSMPPRAG